jgi:hypothetical protein
MRKVSVTPLPTGSPLAGAAVKCPFPLLVTRHLLSPLTVTVISSGAVVSSAAPSPTGMLMSR